MVHHNFFLAFLYHGDAELIIVFSVMTYLVDDLVAGRCYKTIHQVNKSRTLEDVNIVALLKRKNAV